MTPKIDLRDRVLGDLETLGLFDVCQFLMVAGKTGALTVRTEGRHATLTFSNGQIVAALDDALRAGEDVVMQMLRWTTGTFEFQPKPAPPGANSQISMSTGALLLEAARRMDEDGETQPEHPRGADTTGDSPHAIAFLEKQHLAEGFAQLLSSLQTAPEEGLDLRNDVPVDVLMNSVAQRGGLSVELQEGEVPVARGVRGLWPVGPHPAPRRVLDRLASAFLGTADRTTGAETTHFVREKNIDGAGWLHLESWMHRETRHLRLVRLQPAAPALRSFGLPEAGVLPYTRALRGLVLVGSPQRGGKSTLAASMATESMSGRTRHLVHFEETANFRLSAPGSVVERVALPPRKTARDEIATPVWRRKADLIVVDALRGAGHLFGALDAAEEGALVVATIEADDAAGAVARCIALLDRSGAEIERQRLARLLICVLTVRRAPAVQSGDDSERVPWNHEFFPSGEALDDLVRGRLEATLRRAA